MRNKRVRALRKGLDLDKTPRDMKRTWVRSSQIGVSSKTTTPAVPTGKSATKSLGLKEHNAPSYNKTPHDARPLLNARWEAARERNEKWLRALGNRLGKLPKPQMLQRIADLRAQFAGE